MALCQEVISSGKEGGLGLHKLVMKNVSSSVLLAALSTLATFKMGKVFWVSVRTRVNKTFMHPTELYNMHSGVTSVNYFDRIRH